MAEMETTPFGATHHVWTDEATGKERVGEPIYRPIVQSCPNCERILERIRAAIAFAFPDDMTPSAKRFFESILEEESRA